jgi:hypothetical protein
MPTTAELCGEIGAERHARPDMPQQIAGGAGRLG